MNQDRNGNQVDTFGVPTGPIDSQPTAVYHTDGSFKGTESQEVIIRDALARSGVHMGDWDEEIICWLARVGDWSAVATVTSWINRAHQNDTKETTK